MNTQSNIPGSGYRLDIRPLSGTVTAWRGDARIAVSNNARVMYETRLDPVVYFPREDVLAGLAPSGPHKTFCPFKGTAVYMDLSAGDEVLEKAVWSYANPLPESAGIDGYVAFMPGVATHIDIGENKLGGQDDGNISGPLVDWILRGAIYAGSPEELTASLAEKLIENGVALSRLNVMIWSLHPLIAGKNYVWEKGNGGVNTYAPSYEIHDHPAYVNSPLRHVSNGLGGVRQKLDEDHPDNAFPVMQDLRAKGGTDYVAMPLPFSDGRINVLTLTCDHPDGFTTANLGLVFEMSGVISRCYEVFAQSENAKALLETYVGKRTGARVLEGQIRRGDGDEIDAAIMFCDLRGSTRLEETMARDDYIGLLNRFFETTSTIVHAAGGEVLKFIGDAVLAVFPAGDDPERAKRQALQSALDIVARLDASGDEGAPMAECSIGIAFGRVTYGNVGSQERLDFTVIGQPANVAARLGDYCKTTDCRVVVTDDVYLPDFAGSDLGALELHNVSRPVHAYSIGANRV